jgi:DNA-binding MarR family transcriptional regulator
MQLEEIDQRIREAVADERELPRLSRDLGRELSQNRWEILDAFRAAVERHQPQPSNYSRGVLEALSEASRSYQAEVLPKKGEEQVAYLARLRNWLPALRAMEKRPVLPTELGAHLQSEASAVSRLLRDMRQVGLVDLLVPHGADGRFRPHHLTAMGRRVLERLSQDTACLARERPIARDESGSSPPTVDRRTAAGPSSPQAEGYFRVVAAVPQVSRP